MCFCRNGFPRQEIACDNLSQCLAIPERTIAARARSKVRCCSERGPATPPLEAVLVERKPLTFRSGPSWVLFSMPEMNMAKSDQPFVGFNDMMTQNFEQTDATDLKRKIKDTWRRTLLLRTSLYGSYPKPRIANVSGGFRSISCRRNGRCSVNR